MSMHNEYVPFASRILEVIRHTGIEYTFRMQYEGPVKPGQFFEVSLPKFGEAPISVSGIGEGFIDLTIRRVGRVTNEVFEHYAGGTLFIRGPYGNGFDVEDYRGKELVVVAGGTGLSPVRGLVDHFAKNIQDLKCLKLIAGFKTKNDILFQKDLEMWGSSCDITLTVDTGEPTASCKVGLVTEHLKDLRLADVENAAAVVVGPPPMMRFTALGLLDIGFAEHNIWISQERRMCCGIGKCGHCKIGDAYVCVDGPVFNYTRGKALID